MKMNIITKIVKKLVNKLNINKKYKKYNNNQINKKHKKYNNQIHKKHKKHKKYNNQIHKKKKKNKNEINKIFFFQPHILSKKENVYLIFS